MTGTFLLETRGRRTRGTASFTTVAPMWQAGDTIPLGPKTLRVSLIARESITGPTSSNGPM